MKPVVRGTNFYLMQQSRTIKDDYNTSQPNPKGSKIS